MSASELCDITVGPDGSITVPADQVASMGLHPGEHLRLVRGEGAEPQPARRSVRDLGIGQVAVEDVLTWEHFEAVHEANVQAASWGDRVAGGRSAADLVIENRDPQAGR